MALVIDVLIVEVIEEVIITLVLKGSQTVPNILPLKPLLCHGWACNLHRTQTECNIKERRRKLKYSQKIFETLTKLSTA